MEDSAMKKGMGVLNFLFIIGMVLGTMQPAMLYGGETPSGNIWDQFVDSKPYPGIWLKGPLSIYYDYIYDEYGNKLLCDDGQAVANMYYTVRLNQEFHLKPPLYTFQGTTGICLGDFFEQGNVIRDFLGTLVLPGIFPNGFKSWKFKSINKAQYHDNDFSRAFVATIEISVQK
jgi:hypothetical protein